MNVLITGAMHPLAQAMIDSLDNSFSLRLLGGSSGRAGVESLSGNLLDQEVAKGAVSGVEAIVHCGPLVMAESPPAGFSDTETLDHVTRGTYQLLEAAGEAGVNRCLFLSSLLLFRGCPEGSYISEWWMPRPSAEVGPLALYLGELTAREFARERKLTVICLRFASVVQEKEVKGRPVDPRWLDMRDGVSACRKALEMPLERPRWRLYHIACDLPGSPYAIGHAGRHLSYSPEHRFGIEKPEQGGPS